MSRAVTYSVVPRINPNDRDAAPKYYAQAQASGDMNLREMAERIQASCTVTKADVYAVLVALEDVIAESLKAGEIVRLGDLGTFQIGLSGKGAVTQEDYDTSLIKKAHINFRPGLVLSGILSSLSYNKVAPKSAKDEGSEENNSTGDNSSTDSGNSGENNDSGGGDDSGTNPDGGADFN